MNPINPYALKRLPHGYTELKAIYKQAGQNSYINTGIIGSNDIRLDFYGFSALTDTWLFGARKSITERRFALFASPTNNYYLYYGLVSQNPVTVGAVKYSPTYFSIRKDSFYLDNNFVTYITSEPFTTPNPILLFGLYNNTTPLAGGTGEIYCYYCKVWSNNIPVREFIPAMRESDNVVGMYDIVTNTFFTNAGTGTFGYIP